MINVNLTPQQGDAHLIKAPNGKVILIDAGHLEPARAALVPFLQAQEIDKIDVAFITHPHKDHYLGLLAILENGINIDTVFMNGIDRTSCAVEIPWGCDFEGLENFYAELKGKNITVLPAIAGMIVDLGWQSKLKILYAFDGINTPVGTTDVNDRSLIIRLEHSYISALLTGDLNAKLGSYLSKENKDLTADILKLPHHGAETTAPDSFYSAVSPKVALVPSPALLWCTPRSARTKKWLEMRNIPTYVNGFSGHVTVTMSMFGFKVDAERSQTRLPSPECPVS